MLAIRLLLNTAHPPARPLRSECQTRSAVPLERLCSIPARNRVAGGHAPPLLTSHQKVAQNSPTILPSALTSILSAAGTLGRPGMVMISPQTATTNSAPAANRTSRTLTTWSVGAPLRSPLVEKLYWVLAMQTGALP